MTFEARVNTVDAIEFLPCGAPLDVFFSWLSFDSLRAMLRFFRMKNHHTKKVTMAINAIPPMTPPAIAPALLPPPLDGAGCGLLTDVLMHFVDAQAVQDWLIIVQV